MNDVAPPRISRHSAAATVVVGLAVAGALTGALWAWMAPPIHGVIALTKSGDRVHAALGDETDNFFIAAFLLVGMVVVLSVAIGSAAAFGAAAGVGALIVRSRYDVIDIAGAPISPDDRVVYVTEAPPVFFAHTGWVIATSVLFPVALAALVYALIAVSASRDDLGGWPPEEQVLGPPVTVDGALPSVP